MWLQTSPNQDITKTVQEFHLKCLSGTEQMFFPPALYNTLQMLGVTRSK